jgi:ureidoglycolate dehydrogenase (NAD+)
MNAEKQQELVYLNVDELKQLIASKLELAGLSKEHADTTSDHLTYADARGVHSHGSVRVEYYSERIAKGGITADPRMTWERTGPCSGILDGDNAMGFVVAKKGMETAISLARENGIGIVGMRRMGHCGTLSYYLRMAAAEDLVALSMCQSDPMVVPFGGAEAFFGTNPIGFAAPVKNAAPMVFDMATTVGAWGKVLNARSKGLSIPDTWALDAEGKPTTDPFAVRGLVPIAGAKGYGLMMMVDVLSGVLVGAPFGPHVTSMYADLSAGRELGQLHIVIDPAVFCGAVRFQEVMQAMVDELHAVRPAQGFGDVRYPGESSDLVAKRYQDSGIPIPKEIYSYLISDDVHYDRYETGDPFAVAQ